MVLERERQVYAEKRLELLRRYEGKFVAIKGDVVLAPFDSRDEALAAVYDRFGLCPVLVREVQREEPVMAFSRDIF